MFKKFSKINKFGFAFYDFSNSGYVIIFQSFLFPLVIESSAEKPLELWGWAVTASVLISLILSPIIGRIIDLTNKTLPFGILVISIGILAFFTPLIFSTDVYILIFSFVLFNAFFEISQSIYNSYINDIATTHKEKTKLSTFAWGFGYIGGIFFALLYLVLNKIGFSNSFILSISALLFLVISIFPIRRFWIIEKEKGKNLTSLRIENPKTLFKLESPISLRDLFIYWIIADCVAAILYFSALFSKTELGISETTIGALMLGVQLLAFPLTWYSGVVASKFGIEKIIKISLFIWTGVLLILFVSKTLLHLVVVMFLTSFVIGTTQALLRAHLSRKIDDSKAGEGFGFFAIANKSASLLAPALVSLTISIFGAIRPAFLILAILVMLAIFLSRKLKITDDE